MPMIKFTANHEDLSTDRGYQFKFFCDRCRNGYMTPYQASITGTAGSLLRAAGSIFGGILSSAGNSAYEIQRAIGGKAHDDAFAAAVEQGKQHFHHCTRCGNWVCPEACWNAPAGLCENCAPDFQEEYAAHHAQAKAQAAREQLQERARAEDYASGADMRAVAAVSAAGGSCPSCGAKAPGKFCPECGTAVAAARKTACQACGHETEAAVRFCPECGNKTSAWQQS